MDPLKGALLASGIAIASVLAAIFLPVHRAVAIRDLRRVGGVTLVTLGLVVLGLPLPGISPLAVLGAGCVWALWRRPAMHRTTSNP